MRCFGSIVCPELTERQVQIAMLISQFKTNRQIARELGIAQPVVGEHITKMFRTLGFDCRMQLVVWMLKRGLVNLDDIELPTKKEERV